MTSITAVLTAHREAALAGPSIRSFEQAIAEAIGEGLTVESLIVLDRPDSATQRQFAGMGARGHRVMVIDGGDPSFARNAAAEAASGQFTAFLDGDDLWSHNWLVAAHRLCVASDGPVIAHSEVNIVFGELQQMWWHADSAAADFDAGFLRVGNYWDAMCFVQTRVLREYPYRANDLAVGFGHEDWHWNCVTLAAGIEHRPVPDTVHFKRRRPGSQMRLCDRIDALPWPNAVASYGWRPAATQTGTGRDGSAARQAST